MARLLLIRHGQTDYNLNRRYCGFSNPSLNASGVAQAKSLARQLKEFDITTVYSSDLSRAMQTAEILFPGHQIKTTPNFREFNFGIFEGLNYAEITERYPKLYHNWLANPLNVSIPEGEKFADFRNRVDSELTSVISSNRNKTIALVTHSGTIRLILCKVLRYALERFWEISHENAAFSIIDYPEGCMPIAIRINES
jgi:alpha-ribazole phosphatase